MNKYRRSNQGRARRYLILMKCSQKDRVPAVLIVLEFCVFSPISFLKLSYWVRQWLHLLYQGDIAGERITRFKLQVDNVSEKGNSSIPGLGFRLDGQALLLFAVTPNSMSLFSMQDQPPTWQILDQTGCNINSVTMSDRLELIIGRPEAVYFYEVDGRGPCWAFEGEKNFIGWFRGYLFCVIADQRNGKNTINVYDLKNRLIAHSLIVKEVSHLLCKWGNIILIMTDKSTLCISEKDMESKSDMLFKKNLYTVAIKLVQTHQADDAATAEVLRKYGNHLYNKQDYDEAMVQYIHTIGHLEPSYVIQKFLDAQRIYNLTNYLENLHEKGLASKNYTTLLLNCYTKLKDLKKLNVFIKSEDGVGEHKFDVETAIMVCHAANYHEHAITLLELYLSVDLHFPSISQANNEIDFNLKPRPAAAAMSRAVSNGKLIVNGKNSYMEIGKEYSGKMSEGPRLLKSSWPSDLEHPLYDVDLAIVLCKMNAFNEGLLYIYLLKYFGKLGEDCSKEVTKVLTYIERDEILHPIIVLQTLPRNLCLTHSVIKDYIARKLEQELKLIEKDRRAIEKYQEDTLTMRKEIQDLRTNARIFQLSKCTACTFTLDLPAVHFMCMHSFHQRCLGDNEKECPECAPVYRSVMEMKRSLEQNSKDEDRFFPQVKSSKDGFSVIVEYFGKEIISKTSNGSTRTFRSNSTSSTSGF
ncbi:hypothetical protein DITRI_Ditri14bG0141700 [Diplodiscus trichospermus]